MISNNILRAVLESMSKEQKEQLIAELIAEVGNLQPQEPTEEGVEKLKNIVASNADGGYVQIVDENVIYEAQPSQSNNFSTDWGKNIEGKRPVRAQSNTWSDTGEGKDENYDPSQYQKSPRSRPNAKKKLVEKTCSVCNKKFNIDSSLVYGQFVRCDRCT